MIDALYVAQSLFIAIQVSTIIDETKSHLQSVGTNPSKPALSDSVLKELKRRKLVSSKYVCVCPSKDCYR